MNKDFNEWYIENNIITQEEKQLIKRWSGVEDFTKEALLDDITNLTQLFFGYDVEEEFLEKICAFFKKYDEKFSKRALPEIRLLSGAILLQISQTISNYCSYVELLVKSASFVQNSAYNASILYEIELEFSKDCDRIRNDLNTKIKPVTMPNNDKLSKCLEQVALSQELCTELISFVTETSKVFSEINVVINEVSEIHKIRLEESQLLWWLTSGWCELKNCSYKSLTKKEACLFIGYEMAEFVQVFPGPYASNGFIFRMIELCKGANNSVKFTDIVQAISPEFSELYIKKYAKQENLNLLPLSMAIKYANNTSETTEWTNKYTIETNSSNIINEKYTPIEFAKQLYFEILTQKCLDSIDE
ncbi:MAG: hypothetical protein CVU92_09885 [Firmicutes bacterium HGW-Firmicutes-17]|nr:MAG: hypothetical protein CVU92_09885 [Firmicutes bacterium HGW-Firmicutes-17]